MSVDKSAEQYVWRKIKRRTARVVQVGSVAVGGTHPISVQSMTNTKTEDVAGTIAQVRALEEAGADIVRVSCPTPESTVALKKITAAVNVPIVADIHFHYQRAVEAAAAGAACLRFNPGNIGSKEKTREVVAAALDNNCSIRIGVNGGSLERSLLEKYGSPTPEAMVESALYNIALLEELNFDNYKVSVKASDVFMTIAAYRQLATQTDCPLHLGITEAGGAYSGAMKSAIGLGILLAEGLGDTIRVSLAADPVAEVRAAFEILKSLGLRYRGVTIIACPSCARQGFDVIETTRILEERLASITAPITLSIIGCVVNGPGEAAQSDVGFTGGGSGAGMVYVGGKQIEKMPHKDMIEHLVGLVEQAAARYQGQG